MKKVRPISPGSLGEAGVLEVSGLHSESTELLQQLAKDMFYYFQKDVVEAIMYLTSGEYIPSDSEILELMKQKNIDRFTAVHQIMTQHQLN